MRTRRKPVLIVLFWTLALAWIGVLFYFSGQTGEASGALSRRITHLLLRRFPAIELPAPELEAILRKMAHYGIFAVEGLLLGMAMMESRPRCMVELGWLAGMLCAGVAVANELHETLIAGRSCSVVDMLIDTGGAAFGVLFAMLFFRLARRKKHG